MSGHTTRLIGHILPPLACILLRPKRNSLSASRTLSYLKFNTIKSPSLKIWFWRPELCTSRFWLPHQLRRSPESRPATGPFIPRRASVSPTLPILPHPHSSRLTILMLSIRPEWSELLLYYQLLPASLSGFLGMSEGWHPQLSLWGMALPQTETPEAVVPALPSGLMASLDVIWAKCHPIVSFGFIEKKISSMLHSCPTQQRIFKM